MQALTPSFKEDHISQIPALQLLQNLGYTYLTPAEAMRERCGKTSNVILDNILQEQLKKINSFTFKGQQHKFSDSNIRGAVQALKDFPYDGLVRTNEKVYDLLTLGKSFEETVQGDRKSFDIKYIDWKNPENNVYHVTEEFKVSRTASDETCRPDIVLFVNGIPFVVIECKRPDIKNPIEEAVSQQIRNQKDDHIPKLFIYSQVLISISSNDAQYATTGTASKFWSFWKEKENNIDPLRKLINKPLAEEQKEKLFADRFKYVRHYFENYESQGERRITEQDKLLYALCRPERLIELTYQYILFDAGVKKICRYQQYFAVKSTIRRIKTKDSEGKRQGGVIWHTQGSGKSLTMVMMAKAIALEPKILNPRIVLVTDRVDLDDQIWKTFHHCGKNPVQAQTGEHLIDLVTSEKEAIITTIIDKFSAAVKKRNIKNESPNIFILVDESHRSQYGEAHAKMVKVFPKACYIGFTGTPLMKKHKNTADRFGGIIDTYTIDEAVQDKAVVPLLYEGRLTIQDVTAKTIDTWFENVCKPLTEKQRDDLKKKFSKQRILNEAEQKIWCVALDISEHFKNNYKGTGFKAQLTTPRKEIALKYKKYLDEFGMVSSEVLMSGPDTREGHEEIYEDFNEEDSTSVQKFWKAMMDKYGNEKEYNKQIINAFKYSEDPEIIIVIDKLLTGFDEPKNSVLYIARSLKEHTLLQAIARVNRLYEGKDYGYILDYYGLLGELDQALTTYSKVKLDEFDDKDLEGTLINVMEEVKTLPQKYSSLWDIFKEIRNTQDEEEYERLLGDDELRDKFYERLSAYTRTLQVALSTHKFIEETPEEKINKYKKDAKFFLKLRVSVKQRYAETIDFKEYEPKVQKLIDTYITSDEVIKITDLVNIFDTAKFNEEVGKLKNPASKADTIAHRTKKTILEKWQEDEVYYRKFSELLEEAIRQHRAKIISDMQYLQTVQDIQNKVVTRTGDDIPEKLVDREVAKAFFGQMQEVFKKFDTKLLDIKEISADAAIKIDDIILTHKIVDWHNNPDVQNQIYNAIEDYLFSVKGRYNIDLNYDDIDLIIEKVLQTAINRYPG